MSSLIFRKGLDLRHAVAGLLAERAITAISSGRSRPTRFHPIRTGRLTIHLAREFGFCYGVDRAVDYAYQTRQRFPDRGVYLTGEIIHNPHVNDKLRGMGIQFLSDVSEQGGGCDRLGPDDVVILPAFGVTVAMLQDLERRGCTLIDTTCGSVLNVWKNVRRYAEGGYTSIIHGKVWHEETQATASQAVAYGGQYLVVLNDDETSIVCDYIRRGGNQRAFRRSFRQRGLGGLRSRSRSRAASGLPTRLTMLMSESARRSWREAESGDGRPPRRGGAVGPLSGVRHDLQRHPGPPGRRGRLAAGQTHRPGDRHRRLQQQQHVQPRTPLRRLATDVSHRRSRLSALTDRDPPPADGHENRSHGDGLAAGPRRAPRSTSTSGASTPDNLVGEVVLKLSRFTDSPT